MQVNLKYHPAVFANLEQAFDPYVNAVYAADFVQRLGVSTHSWAQAVRQYRSSRRVQGRKYRCKFQNIWYAEARLAAKIEGKKRVAFFRKRQLARLAARR